MGTVLVPSNMARKLAGILIQYVGIFLWFLDLGWEPDLISN